MSDKYGGGCQDRNDASKKVVGTVTSAVGSPAAQANVALVTLHMPSGLPG